MSPETINTLYWVLDLMKESRNMLDKHMYGRSTPLEPEDLNKCREVYDAVCKVCDLL